MLWFILTLIDGIRIKPYSKIKEEAFTGKDEIKGQDTLDKKLDKETGCFYESDMLGIDNHLYRICIRRLRDLIDEYDLQTATKINTFYEMTGNDPRYKRFFWDTVTWDEIKPWCECEETVKRN